MLSEGRRKIVVSTVVHGTRFRIVRHELFDGFEGHKIVISTGTMVVHGTPDAVGSLVRRTEPFFLKSVFFEISF